MSILHRPAPLAGEPLDRHDAVVFGASAVIAAVAGAVALATAVLGILTLGY